ncbi:MAG: peptidylprolyl isomerase [Lachnospiraceae bacterium]|jgi:hypothetical protein|nr:peptidylprolyl isomerase [Lachnospiraceae bacterium]
MSENINLFGSPQQQLEVVNDAIVSILRGGQSYKIGTRQLTRADLAQLRQMQSQLQSQIAAGRDSSLFGDTVVAVFEGR